MEKETPDSPRARKRKPGHPPLDGMKQVFLQEYRNSGFILQTCKRIGVARNRVNDWLEQDQKFAAEFQIADEEVTEKYELAAGSRAVNGWEEPIYQHGKQVGTIRRYSDKLLELLLKARNRAKYGERIDYHVDEDALAAAIATRFVSIVRRVAPDVCPGCKTRLDISPKIAEELLQLSTFATEKAKS